MKESRSLPQSRHTQENQSIFESYESITIPAGKCSLKQALTFLLQHKHDSTYNSESIATEYKIDKKVVGTLHFIFALHLQLKIYRFIYLYFLDDILKHFKLYVTVSSNDQSPKEIEDPFEEAFSQALELKKKKDLEKKK